MFEHKIEKLSPHVTLITDPTGVFLFLVEGSEQAVLIDTGVGFVGLKETVDSLTSKPLQVILTHMHPDHAGGAAVFEDVYLHPADLALTAEQAVEGRLGYAIGSMGGAPVNAEDLIPAPGPDKVYQSLSDGQLFDLGGLTLQVIHVPGHTPGSCCVLLQEERSILFGDACNANTLLMWGTTISAYKNSLQYLQSFEGRFDTVYYSHGPAPEGPGCSLEDNLELCDRILSRTDDAVPTEFIGMPALRAAEIHPWFARVDGKYGNIVYTEEVRK
ncbi:MAG: MBL fold metallo-hydrolase [Faecousia sp.]